MTHPPTSAWFYTQHARGIHGRRTWQGRRPWTWPPRASRSRSRSRSSRSRSRHNSSNRAADVRYAQPIGPPGTRTRQGEPLNFHIQDEAVDDTTHVIELGGEVDLYTAPEFKERMVELIESGKKQIVVDLSKATFIDSTTLGVLVGGVKRLRPAGGSLALVCTDENITKIFEITGLDRVFPIHSSREEALEAVSSGATD